MVVIVTLLLWELFVLYFSFKSKFAQKTVQRMVDKVVQLYEQGADKNGIETYLKR
jgi:hypothetical protein